MDETGDGPAEGDPQRSHRGAPDQPGEPHDQGEAPRAEAPAWLPRRLRSSLGPSAARGAWSRASRHPSEARAHDEMSSVPRATVPAMSGTSNFARAEVPYGIDLAAAWSWRLLVIVAAGFVVLQAVELLAVVLLPVVVALFIAALTVPVVELLTRVVPRGVAALLVVLGVLGTVAVMLSFATQQVVDGFSNLTDQTVEGLERIQEWLQNGPLQISEQQINKVLQDMQDLVTTSNELVSRVTEVSTTVGHVVAGVFIVLFSTYFFLADGDKIWAWVVRIFPIAARPHADSSGRVAWLSLTQFVRATVLVAAVDAIGVMIVAAVLQVPFVGAIGVLVFLGAFVPVIGASISGLIAVLVALVAQGPVAALLMLLGVVGVQQLESHLLQPFLMGRMVRLHPLGVILAVAGGVLIAGIAGALIAVPVVASVNAVATHLAGRGRAVESSEVTSDEEEQQVEEPGGAT